MPTLIILSDVSVGDINQERSKKRRLNHTNVRSPIAFLQIMN